MQDSSSADKDHELWVLVCQACHAALRARQKELNQYGISAMQGVVLFIIQAIGSKATPAEISRWLFREPHSVSGMLNRMEKQGLVRKVKDLDKKNLVRIAMTEKGQDAYYETTKRGLIHKMMSSLSKEQRQQLRWSLETLRDEALKELGVERKPSFP